MMKVIYKIVLLLLLAVGCQSPHQKVAYEDMVNGFAQPQENNSLWCYWYWVGDDVSKEGITKDLEAMKAAGIGAALIGNINPDEVDGKVPMLSEEWWDCMVHAVNEGKRIGVDIGAFNCPGWSQSGGPWVKAEMAMRYLNYSETITHGGQIFRTILEKPNEEFQDLCVLAFPKNKVENHLINASNTSISVSPRVDKPERLLDGDEDESVSFSAHEHTLHFKLDSPIVARRLLLYPGHEKMAANCEIQAQVNGEYQAIKSFRYDRTNFSTQVGAEKQAPVSITLPATKARKFKLVCSDIDMSVPTGFSEIVISEAPIIENYVEKHLGKMHPTPQPLWNTYSWPIQNNSENTPLFLNKNEVLDISTKMDKNGMLAWNVPEGEWVIMRMGLSPTGTMNSPAAPQGKGYEIDKMNESLIRYHFDQFIGEFLRRIPEQSKDAFKYVIADSYEMGAQNWTDGFAESFEARYGYDPQKYLPTFSGRVVGSEAESDRFLWDLRRAIADDVAYKYCGGLRKVSNENGLKLWLENYGHWGFPSEFLMYGGQSDFVSGEYWNEGTLGNIECKAASSAAHIYGKNRVSAECFTAAHRSYVRHPAMLKKRGDWALTEGINHHVLHLYIHQPDDTRQPGVNAWFSTEFNRHNTWFKQGKAYFDYLRRCQHMLQQGTYAADVCYFIGEDAPIMTGACVPELPRGYSFDYINAEVIKDQMTVKDGRFTLPDGMSYKVMVLPPLKTMRPELLSKIKELVKLGGVVYGEAPKHSPSLENYPQCDEDLREMTTELWHSTIDPVKPYGEGYVINGLTLQEVFDYFNLEKDVEVQPNVLWTHRTMPTAEVYFLTNQSDSPVEIRPSFRVDKKHVQLWDAVDGSMRDIRHFELKEGRIQFPLSMSKDQSYFVVFTDKKHPSIKPADLNNKPVIQSEKVLDEKWDIHFKYAPSGFEKTLKVATLFDWTQSTEEDIKYYSGTALYTTTFKFSNTEEEVFLDLGKVGVIASVVLNGTQVGISWMAPYRLNITDALKEGKNSLEIEVVNVWRNRLTGDLLLPQEQKTTWTCVDTVSNEEELISSGLIGPVRLLTLK